MGNNVNPEVSVMTEDRDSLRNSFGLRSDRRRGKYTEQVSRPSRYTLKEGKRAG